MDTVRADRVSTYGYGRPTTPQVDQLAKAGVLFEDVTAPAPWTVPSHASLFTGRPPWVHGAHNLGAGEAGVASRDGSMVGRLRGDLPTLAERLTAAGYRTVALSSNPWLGPELGLMRGFEVARVFDDTPSLQAAVAEEIASPHAKPLFLFVNLMLAHSPYDDGPPPWSLPDTAFLDPETAPTWVHPYLTQEPRGLDLNRGHAEGKSAVVRLASGALEIAPEDLAKIGTLYDAGVVLDDYVFHQIIDDWTSSFDEGVVIVTSDHGECLGEHDLLDHHFSVYPELLKVPLVIAAPGIVPTGRRVHTPVQLQDLYPTLLELAGVERREGSLVPVMRRDAPREGPIVAASWPEVVMARELGGRFAQPMRLYRQGSLALVLTTGESAELYDLAMDPGMTTDLAEQRPDVFRALQSEAKTYFETQNSHRSEALDLPPEEVDRLKQLGYIVE